MLSMQSREEVVQNKLEIGDCVDATIIRMDKNGLEVEVHPHKIQAFVPIAHLSTSLNLTSLLFDTYKIGDTICNLLCISCEAKPILSLREAVAYEKQNLHIERAKDLKIGSIVRCEYVNNDQSGIFVKSPCTSHVMKFKILNDDILNSNKIDVKKLQFVKHQALLAKVTKLNPKKNILHATAKLSDVFSYNYEHTLDLWEKYLLDIDVIKNNLLNCGSPLATVELGQRIQCEVSAVRDGNCKVIINKCVPGLVSTNHFPKNITVGQKLLGVVLWVNYEEKFVEVSLSEEVIKKINKIQDGNIDKPLGSTIYADILITCPKYVIGVLKGENTNKQLIFLPPKLHENAFIDVINYGNVHKSVKVVVSRNVNNKLIGMHKTYIQTLQKAAKRKLNEEAARFIRKKPCLDMNTSHNNFISDEDDYSSKIRDSKEMSISRHISADNDSVQQNVEDVSFDGDSAQIPSEKDSNDGESDQIESDKSSNENCDNSNSVTSEDLSDSDEVSGQCDNLNDISDKRQSEESDIAENATDIESNKFSNPVLFALPGIQNYFSDSCNPIIESSSDEDIEKNTDRKQKKKKLTSAERNELARLEEIELVKKEIENADLITEPQTVQQFQKLVKGKPNCSKSWSKYIVHLAANAEIDKARSVAREALKTIDFNLTEERLNIWVLCLNLENSYGDKNTFEEIFQEAIRCNNDQKIYLTTIKILADSQKYTEMEEKIQKARKKFKQVKEVWVAIGRIYYTIGKLNEARNLKDSALKSIASKPSHIQLIIDFAIMEFQFGERNQGEALFETVLQYSPRRIDIWSRYIDQVVKKGDFDVARRLWERTKSQDIPQKKLKTLSERYTKYGIIN